MKILYFLGSLFLTVVALSLTGCQMTEPFIQVNLGPSVGGSVGRPMPMRPPQMMPPPQHQMQRGGYPPAGGYGGYQQPYGQPYGYGGQPYYGYNGGYNRQPYMSGNARMLYGQWIPQEALRQSQYFMPRYPNGFMRRGNSGCHRPPPPPRCDGRRHHRR